MKKFNRFKRYIAALSILIMGSASGFAQSILPPADMMYEHITRFHSDIRINKDCTVDITEQIEVVALGFNIKHGIYRDLPLQYDYQGGTTNVDFQLVHVKLDGKQVDYHTESLSNGIRIYMGSEETQLLTGKKYQFELSYKVDWVLNTSHPKFDELYWNVNGLGWDFEIDSLTALVHLPQNASLFQQRAYTGAAGSTAQNYDMENRPDGLLFHATEKIGPRENMTIAVGFDKQHLIYPSGLRYMWYWVRSHFVLLICALGFVVLFFHNLRTWFRYGRDPKPGTIVPQYNAPKEFSPAEAAMVYSKGRNHNAALTAEMISIATKGHMKIEVEDPSGFLSKRSYTFTRTDDTSKQKNLYPTETFLKQELVGHSSVFTFQEKTYNPALKSAKESLIALIQKEHGETYHLRRNSFKWRQYGYMFLIIIIAVLGLLVFGGNGGIIVGFGVATLVMNIIFGVLYEQPTRLGRQKLDELEGFKLYMQYADKERIRLNNPPSMNFHHFEENLPYAIALGVAKEWTGQFDVKELERGMQSGHIWYYGAAFHMAHSFDFSGLSSTISSASVPPSSSSGSGGGGFSGGGGGGGGGGGW